MVNSFTHNRQSSERQGNQPFVHLHVHTEYSLLDGASRIEQLVQEAARLGQPGLAITDHGVMYGTIPFYKACLRHGIKPIIGVEVYVTNDPLEEKGRKDKQRLYHLLLLAENNTGYRNLMRLTTKAHVEGFYYKPRVTKKWLAEYGDGLICLSGCLAGELQQAILRDELEDARRIACEHHDLFGKDNYFIELQDHGMPEQKKVNPRLVRLAEELDIPLVVTNDVHYTFAKDAFAHDCLLCIGTASRVKDEDRLRFPGPHFYLKSSEEMRSMFPHLPAAYDNILVITERCQVEIPLGGEILPEFPVPEGTSKADYLREQCERGMQERYDEITPEMEERLAYELSVITKMGYDDYFLIVWDFMRFAHDQGILTGPGRGSAAGSLVAYVLKITNVDPIRYHLLFERFLNPERVSMPDIDIDFSDRRRDEVLQYVVRKYGYDRVAQIITFGTLGAKAAVRDVGRVLGVPLPTVDQVSKCIPSGPGVTLDKAYRQSNELQRLAEQSEEVRNILKIARQLEGVPRHTSTHAAGVVMAKEPLTQYVPLQEGHDHIALTQYPMEDLEEIGLLKMDFLGLRNLTLMEEIVRIVNEQRKQDGDERLFSLEDIPLDDDCTYALLSEADTAGVFQLESAGMKSVLRRLAPSHFEDIIAVLALYRPGPMQNIPLFIDAKHGRTEVNYPHPDLEPILKDTYGIIVYQEQIMQIAAKMAGFSLGEADLLRRAVGKKKRDILEAEREHFIAGCLEQGYEQDVAGHVYDLIVRFADYGFNRCHSAAYAVIAYQLAYLKAHFPVAFLASLLSMNVGAEEKVAEYMNQAAQREIRILPPSVLHSGPGFSVEEGGIRFGLGVVKHVGSNAIQEIMKARADGPFQSLLDFCQRVNLRICNRRVLESLILAGAVDELDMHRAQALANLDEVLEMSERAQGLADSDQLFFFADELPADYEWKDVEPYSTVEKLKYEKEVLGFYLSGHPLDPYRQLAGYYGAVSLPEVKQQKPLSKRIRTIGYVNKVKRITTKKGQDMAFVQLEDRGVELDAVTFPNVYATEPLLYRGDTMLFVEGELEERNDRLQLVIRKARDLVHMEQRSDRQTGHDAGDDNRSLFIKVSAEMERSTSMVDLKRLLQKNSGKSPVFLYYEQSKKTIQLPRSYCVQISEPLIQRLQQITGDPQAIKTRKL